MIGIPKGFKKVGVRKATADITDCKGMILSKGQRFFVLELKKMKRPKGFSIIIAVDNGFEDDVIAQLSEVIKFLKKEYKAITGNTLALTLEGEHHVRVERISNYRTNLQAHCDYRIGGLTDVVEVNKGTDKERLEGAVKDWLALSSKNKRPSNDTRKGK